MKKNLVLASLAVALLITVSLSVLEVKMGFFGPVNTDYSDPSTIPDLPQGFNDVPETEDPDPVPVSDPDCVALGQASLDAQQTWLTASGNWFQCEAYNANIKGYGEPRDCSRLLAIKVAAENAAIAAMAAYDAKC